MKEKGGFSTRERGTSVNYYPSRRYRTVKTRFIPDSSYATDRCHVIATLEKRLRGKRRPVSKPPSTERPRFNRIVIKLPSIRTNARANSARYEKARVPAEENRKCHSSFVCPSGKVLTAPSCIRDGKFAEGNPCKKKHRCYARRNRSYGKMYRRINYAKTTFTSAARQ